MGFFSKYKTLFLIVLFLAVVGFIGYLLFTLFFKPATQTTPPAGQVSTSTGQLPAAGTGQLTPGGTVTAPGNLPAVTTPEKKADTVASGGITKTTTVEKTPALRPTLSSNGSGIQYYNQGDGKFYRLDENGKMTAMSDKVFYNVQNVVWSPKKDRAVLEYPDGSKIVYNFKEQKQVTLPKHWEDFQFSPDGGQLVMKSLGIDPENRWLAISSNDGSGSQAIEMIGENDGKVISSWSPNGQSIAMYTQGVDFNREEVFFVGLHGENFKSAVIQGRGFQPQWSEKGDRLLYSSYDLSGDMRPRLWIVNAEGDNIGTGRQSLGVATWASKCVFSTNTEVYCGVPKDLPEGSGLLPDLAKQTNDDLYKINLVTGEKSLVAIPEGSFNMSNLTVTADKSALYFTDANTNLIEKIKLK